jgi:hypothetical protein
MIRILSVAFVEKEQSLTLGKSITEMIVGEKDI